MLLGDLNILEPGHRPHYPFFAPFEYDFYRGWVGRTGDGYRYDHAFCADSLRDHITAFGYVHEPRRERLSDHSALSLRLSLAPPLPLPASDPATALAPLSLF